MAITLGKDAVAPPFGVGIISATFTEEQEQIDVTNRSNMGGSTGGPGYRAYAAGFVSRTWEIECHDATGLVTQLETNTDTNGYIILSVGENIGVDGAVTFTVTAREA
jgi:hypothetical protein